MMQMLPLMLNKSFQKNHYLRFFLPKGLNEANVVIDALKALRRLRGVSKLRYDE